MSHQKPHLAHHLIHIFNGLFGASFQTVLVRGDAEPIYLPSDGENPQNRVVFAHGYFASALHEIAHWCIAGKKRRTMVDFGYWYRPDGRTTQEQSLFEKVEVKPQALEWIFSVSANHPFHFSADNIAGGQACAGSAFKQSVWHQVHRYLHGGLPKRASQFQQALSRFYGGPQPLQIACFARPESEAELTIPHL